jgi:hypothetical protein
MVVFADRYTKKETEEAMLCLFAKDNRFRANQLRGRSLDEDRSNLQELLSVLGARVARIIDSVEVSLRLVCARLARDARSSAPSLRRRERS